MSHADWRAWWNSHAAEVEERCDRFTFLRLKCRGLGEAESILEAHGISAQRRAGYCRRCGERLFIACPGKTTVEEIRALPSPVRCGDASTLSEKDGFIQGSIARMVARRSCGTSRERAMMRSKSLWPVPRAIIIGREGLRYCC